MNKKNVWLGFVLSGCVCVSLLCTSPLKTAGNSSQTPNALVGKIYEPDGKTPAEDVRVFIRPYSSIAAVSGTETVIGANDTSSVLTNNEGEFAFDTSLNNGMYVIEATSGTNAVFIDSIPITKNTETDTLPPDTLKPAGAIKGKVILPVGGDPSEVYVLAFGIDRFASVNTDGSFTFFPLAEGKYNLRLISSLENYKTLDTNQVAVVSSDTTDIGTLSLPYNASGIPIPANVSVSYDIKTEMISVHWSRLDTAVVKNYNVYIQETFPRHTEKDFQTVCDTFFSEQIFETPGYPVVGIFEYRIAGVDINGTEGPQSSTVRFEKVIDTAVEVNTSIGLGQSFGTINMAVDAQNNFWIADYDHAKVYRYSSTGELITQWEMEPDNSTRVSFLGTHPSAMDLDSQKNVYLKDLQSISILKYDSAGTLIKKITDTTGITIFDISVDRNGFVYANFMRKAGDVQCINKYDLDLNLIKSWETSQGVSTSHGLLARNGKVYCTERGSGQIYDDEGRYYKVADGADELAIDKNGDVYGVDAVNNMVWISDSSSFPFPLSSFKITSGLVSMDDNLFGIAIMDDGTIALGLEQSDTHTCTIHFFRRPQ